MWEDEEALADDVEASYHKGYAEGLKDGSQAGIDLALLRLTRVLTGPGDSLARKADIESSLRSAMTND